MITMSNETRAALNKSIEASWQLAAEARAAGNEPYAAANDGYAHGLRHVLSLEPDEAPGAPIL